MSGKITVTNQSPQLAVIDIEGVIGVPEGWQFEEPGQRVATYETFHAVVSSLKELEVRQVVINIRSTGGNVNDALLIYDTLKGLGVQVTTKCFGYVASAATVIAQAASPGCREISANSLYLIHRSVCTAEGNAQEITRSAEMLDKTDERLASIYAASSGKPADGFAALMEENNGNGRWLSPQETVEYGLVDRVTETMPLNSGLAEEICNLGLPPVPRKLTGKTRNKERMNISKRWKAILDLLGVATAGEGGKAGDFVTGIEMEGIAEGSDVGKEGKGDGVLMHHQKHEPMEACGLNGEVTAEHVAEAIDTSGKNLETGKTDMNITVADVPDNRVKELETGYLERMGELQNRISMLEAQNARLSVRPTMTKSKEDPSHQEMRLSANHEAYMQDLKGFK